MTATRTCGLTLGKFAPLHKGHQLLIETALVEVDELVVLVYDSPRVTAVPLRVRCGWIRDLYPRVTVVEARGGPTEVGHTHGIKEAHERYVLEALGIRGVTHFYSGEFYGEHMSVALGAIDRRIDPERKQFPVSGSLIRQAPHRWREYIHPRVYRDLVVNVALLGAPSTGKTTLAERLALEYSTNWMPEYGREYWETHQVNRRLTPDQLVDIAEGHLESEEELLRCAKRFLFTDTNAITTLMFALDYHGGSPVRLAALARACVERYHVTLLCETDIPYEDSWDRSGAVHRESSQAQLVGYLEKEGLQFVRIRGDLEKRVRRVRKCLRPFEPYPMALESRRSR